MSTAPTNARWTLDDKLSPGAYVLSAKGADASSRQLVLVSDAALTTKATRRPAPGLVSRT